jgi:tetratricopeptide (TPR) repeat protein
VAWLPQAGDGEEQIFQFALDLLRQGDYRSAEPILRALLARQPSHGDALYNLGMMLSDQRQTPEAIELLGRFVELAPDSANGWTALGVAHSRNRAPEAAEQALRRALDLDPDNAYALHNLGTLLLPKRPQEAFPCLDAAARLLPNDPRAQFALAECLLALGKTDLADPVLIKTIQLDPLSDVAEMARTARTRLAGQTLRQTSAGETRPDAVQYCLDALQRFQKLDEKKTRAVIFEIANLGRSGLDINNPAKKYSLSSLPGQFSGLHLVSLMYTGLQQLAPTADAGIDLSRELAAARAEFERHAQD